MINSQTVSVNNLDSPEHVKLLMFMLKNHPIGSAGSGYINQIINDAPGRYTMVVRFRGVSAVAIVVGKALEPEIAHRIQNALEENQRDLGPLVDIYEQRWRDRMVDIHALRDSYRKMIIEEKCPEARSRLQDGREVAVEEKMKGIREDLKPLLLSAFPLYKNGVSWHEFVQTVLTNTRDQ